MGGITKTLGLAIVAGALAAQLTACAAPAPGTASPGLDAEPVAVPAAAAAGFFTSSQASRGERRFEQLCADCHRTVEITRSWFSGTVHRSAGDLFVVMSMTMPETNPGGLDLDAYADILAYLLELNDYPAGDEALPADASALAAIAIPAP